MRLRPIQDARMTPPLSHALLEWSSLRLAKVQTGSRSDSFHSIAWLLAALVIYRLSQHAGDSDCLADAQVVWRSQSVAVHLVDFHIPRAAAEVLFGDA